MADPISLALTFREIFVNQTVKFLIDFPPEDKSMAIVARYKKVLHDPIKDKFKAKYNRALARRKTDLVCKIEFLRWSLREFRDLQMEMEQNSLIGSVHGELNKLKSEINKGHKNYALLHSNGFYNFMKETLHAVSGVFCEMTDIIINDIQIELDKLSVTKVNPAIVVYFSDEERWGQLDGCFDTLCEVKLLNNRPDQRKLFIAMMKNERRSERIILRGSLDMLRYFIEQLVVEKIPVLHKDGKPMDDTQERGLKRAYCNAFADCFKSKDDKPIDGEKLSRTSMKRVSSCSESMLAEAVKKLKSS